MVGADGYLHDAEDCAEEICLPDGDMQPDPAALRHEEKQKTARNTSGGAFLAPCLL